jgi:hypothetical protein
MRPTIRPAIRSVIDLIKPEADALVAAGAAQYPLPIPKPPLSPAVVLSSGDPP